MAGKKRISVAEYWKRLPTPFPILPKLNKLPEKLLRTMIEEIIETKEERLREEWNKVPDFLFLALPATSTHMVRHTKKYQSNSRFEICRNRFLVNTIIVMQSSTYRDHQQVCDFFSQIAVSYAEIPDNYCGICWSVEHLTHECRACSYCQNQTHRLSKCQLYNKTLHPDRALNIVAKPDTKDKLDVIG
uniref:Uncharacterized protein n=1 Tax=Tetranychus urticae TaxID=32264 RepID=T1KA90_TETUR